MASVILSFYDPRNFGVLDQHMWKALKKERKVSGDLTNERDHSEAYLRALRILRNEARQSGFSTREVEIAYFAKDYYGD